MLKSMPAHIFIKTSGSEQAYVLSINQTYAYSRDDRKITFRMVSVQHFINEAPDLNPIEHLWDVVEGEIRIKDVQPTNLILLCQYGPNL